MQSTESRVDETMRVVPGSSGSLLCPPGHPMLRFKIEAGPRNNPNLIAGLDYALVNEYGDVPMRVKNRVMDLFEAATLVRSELWERHVYAYFRHGYSPDGADRNVNRALIVGQRERVDKGSAYDSLNRGDIVRPDDPRVVPEHHLGYLTVRSYFPDAEPRLDLIALAETGGFIGYGTQPCARCEKTLQYEAKVDAFAEAISANRACPSGGLHEIAERA